jgi:hypothetical protein
VPSLTLHEQMRLLLAMFKHEMNTFPLVPTPSERFFDFGEAVRAEEALSMYRGTGRPAQEALCRPQERYPLACGIRPGRARGHRMRRRRRHHVDCGKLRFDKVRRPVFPLEPM